MNSAILYQPTGWSILFLFLFNAAQAQVNEATSTQKMFILHTYGLDTTTSITSRVNPADKNICLPVMVDGRTHKLTEEEFVDVERAVRILPPLHQLVLQKHLCSIHFMDNMTGIATAMTIPIHTEEYYPLFDIVIRAETLHQTVS